MPFAAMRPDEDERAASERYAQFVSSGYLGSHPRERLTVRWDAGELATELDDDVFARCTVGVHGVASVVPPLPRDPTGDESQRGEFVPGEFPQILDA